MRRKEGKGEKRKNLTQRGKGGENRQKKMTEEERTEEKME